MQAIDNSKALHYYHYSLFMILYNLDYYICRPLIIVRPYSAEDVAIVVTFAVRHRFQVNSHHHLIFGMDFKIGFALITWKQAMMHCLVVFKHIRTVFLQLSGNPLCYFSHLSFDNGYRISELPRKGMNSCSKKKS